MKIRIVPAFEVEKNYMYLIVDERSGKAAAVDPVAPDKMMAAAEEEGADIVAILTTHHHWDHAGGHKEMLRRIPDLRVYGNDERIYGQTDRVAHGETIVIGDSIKIRALLTPCHTRGHVCYYIDDKQHPGVFTGDTLFLGGCGHFFEGDGADMYRALVHVLGRLPDNTRVYCGHEYALNSLAFAVHAQPDNRAARDKLEWARMRVEAGEWCSPSLMSEEKEYNPFMRVEEEEMMLRCGTGDPARTMDHLRSEKNNFMKRSKH